MARRRCWLAATYWHMLPAYSQGRKAIWTAVNPHTGKSRIDEAFPHELRHDANEQEMFIRLKNGATWQVLGYDRTRRGRLAALWHHVFRMGAEQPRQLSVSRADRAGE